MRSLMAALLLVVATSAMAQTPYSIDFYYDHFDVAQGEWPASMPLRINGKLSGPTLFSVNWTYSFDVGAPRSGTIEITENTTSASFPVEGPITSSYIGSVPGTATISYQLPGQQPVTKTIPMTLFDQTMSLRMDGDRVLESDTSEHAVTFHLSKPTTRPLTVKASTQSGTAFPGDYTLLDTVVNIAPGVMTGQVRYAVTPDGIPENDEYFSIITNVYDGTRLVGWGGCSVTITDRQIRAMFVPDQLNVFAGDPFSLMVVLSEPMVLPRYSPRTSMMFSSSNPGVVSSLPSPLPVGDSTIVGTMTASAVLPGDAVVTAEDADAGSIVPAAAHIHVYDATISFGDVKTLVVAPEQSVTIPVDMTPPPPEPIDLFAIEDRFAGFVDLDSFVKIDASGHGTLTIKGKKVGTTIVAIESPGRRRISGIDVAVRNAPVPPPPPPPPSRRRSAHH